MVPGNTTVCVYVFYLCCKVVPGNTMVCIYVFYLCCKVVPGNTTVCVYVFYLCCKVVPGNTTVCIYVFYLCYKVVPGNTTVPNVQRVTAEPQDVVDDRDQPLYVNAKQYHRILKRRQARAKLEAAGKIPKERRVRRDISTV